MHARSRGPYAKEWMGYKRSTVGEATATNTEALRRARVLPEFGDETLITAPVCRGRRSPTARSNLVSGHTTEMTEVQPIQRVAIEMCGDGAQSRRCQPGPEPQRRDATEGELGPHNLPLAKVVVTSWPSSVNTGVHGFNALAVVTRR